jgi:hypothetical protein
MIDTNRFPSADVTVARQMAIPMRLRAAAAANTSGAVS